MGHRDIKHMYGSMKNYKRACAEAAKNRTATPIEPGWRAPKRDKWKPRNLGTK